MAEQRCAQLQRQGPKCKSFGTNSDSRDEPAGKAPRYGGSGLQRLRLCLFTYFDAYIVIIRHYHPAAIRVNAFEHLETKERSATKSSHQAPAITSANRLSAIFNDYEPVGLRHRQNFAHLARPAI